MAEDTWNTRDPAKVALAYSVNSIATAPEFIHGREVIEARNASRVGAEQRFVGGMSLSKLSICLRQPGSERRRARIHASSECSSWHKVAERSIGIRGGTPVVDINAT
jgi:hypothetical protein